MPDPSGAQRNHQQPADGWKGLRSPSSRRENGTRASRHGGPKGQGTAPAQTCLAAAPQSCRFFMPSLHPTSTTAEPQTTPFRAKLSTSPSPPSAELGPSQLTFLTGEGKRIYPNSSLVFCVTLPSSPPSPASKAQSRESIMDIKEGGES